MGTPKKERQTRGLSSSSETQSMKLRRPSRPPKPYLFLCHKPNKTESLSLFHVRTMQISRRIVCSRPSKPQETWPAAGQYIGRLFQRTAPEKLFFLTLSRVEEQRVFCWCLLIRNQRYCNDLPLLLSTMHLTRPVKVLKIYDAQSAIHPPLTAL